MKKRVYKIISIVLIVVIVCLLGYVCYRWWQAKESVDTLKEQKDVIENISVDTASIVEESYSNKIDYLKNYYGNNDIVGILYIDNLNISAVLTQYSDNSYYLKHNVKGKNDIYGNVFVDYRTNLNSSKQINIYGHSDQRQNVPFAKLSGYLNYDTYKNNKYIKLETESGIRTYLVFAVDIVSDSNAYHMQVMFDDSKGWESHFLEFKQNSIFDTDVSISSGDNILVLQTCIYSDDGDYVVIAAKEV